MNFKGLWHLRWIFRLKHSVLVGAPRGRATSSLCLFDDRLIPQKERRVAQFYEDVLVAELSKTGNLYGICLSQFHGFAGLYLWKPGNKTRWMVADVMVIWRTAIPWKPLWFLQGASWPTHWSYGFVEKWFVRIYQSALFFACCGLWISSHWSSKAGSLAAVLGNCREYHPNQTVESSGLLPGCWDSNSCTWCSKYMMCMMLEHFAMWQRVRPFH